MGFRPFVYKLAYKNGLKGTVCNTTDGVHILINSTSTEAERIAQDIERHAPVRAVITNIEVTEVDHEMYSDFRIIGSSDKEDKQVLLTPDFGICDQCAEDVLVQGNKRENYAFTTCTICGPRYSIVEKLPYDRENTAMCRFTMCDDCQNEYLDIQDRRYYSQTNSCPSCAVSMTLEKVGESQFFQGSQTAMIHEAVSALEAGKIIAIKGIGGYLITCDATNKEVIRRLRGLKNRPSKPLAVMYHDFLLMAEDVDVDVVAMLELQRASSPIVLLPKKKDPWSNIAFDEIAPGLKKVGVMLPYTPLYVMLLKKFGRPIIATSGNMSGDPIEFIESNARDLLSPIVDLFIHNNRSITVPQDDSVIAISPLKKRRVVIRRSRGLAPTLIAAPNEAYKQCVLTMGGLLKSTIGLSAHGNLYVSQYLGDTDAYQTQKNYSEILKHFLNVLEVQPSVILCDQHPSYYSSQEGERLAGELKLPLIKVQHHLAHFYAVLGEHQLFKCPDPILGVIWDGTGLGEDGHIWGGEMFLYQLESAQRIDHLPYFDYIAGDKMAREPRISALTIVQSFEIESSFLEEKFTNQEWLIYQSIIQKGSKIRCSSMGRLFDAVASIVLGIDKQSYEGEAAMLLENAAHLYFEQHLPQMSMSYLNDQNGTESIIHLIVNRVIKDMLKGVDPSFISARFHVSLVDYIDRVATYNTVHHLAFSGGVFQNVWLIDLIHLFLSKKYALYFHQELSPNDESISFGQLMYYFETQNK